MADPTLDLSAIEAAIADTTFSGHVTHLTSVDSTQNLAHAAAQAGARCGVWIADEQTAGRGRGAHTWHSPYGDSGEAAGLYMTALTSPALAMESTLRLSFTVAIAVQAAIAGITGFAIPHRIDIRWPNDLVIPQRAGMEPAGPSRKVGGILIELAAHPAGRASPAMLKHAVIGIGVNLNRLTFPPELDAIATSLRRELPGQPILPREPLAAAILRNLDTAIHQLTSSNSQLAAPNSPLALHSTWLIGKRVRVEPREDQPSYTGVTAGLDSKGFLLVQGDDGQLYTVFSGGLREP